MRRFSWNINPNKEQTQSSTYGPLIALGIDRAQVTFPEGWEEKVFNFCLNEPAGKNCLSEFTNLNEFSRYVNRSLITHFGDSSLDTFLRNCDGPGELHLPGEVQEQILYENPYVEGLLECIIRKTKELFKGQMITSRIMKVNAAAAAASAPSPEGGTTSSAAAAQAAPPAQAAQSAQAAPPAQGWSCSACTLNNPAAARECTLCGTKKSGGRRKSRRRSKAKKAKTLRRKHKRRS